MNKYFTILLLACISITIHAETKREITHQFYKAISNNDLRAVKQLIESGIDPNIQDQILTTPLMFASYYGYYEISEYLIDHGADVNMKNIRGETPLMMALDHCDSETAMLLLEHGAEINVSERYGTTPLMFALKSSEYKIAKILIEKGADVNARSRATLETPLLIETHHKYTKQSYEMMKLLLEKGANPNVKDYAHRTPLILGVRYNYKIVPLLIEYGAKIDTRSYGYYSALYEACTDSSCFKSAKYLLEQGAKTNGTGLTDLMIASIHSDLDEVKKLVTAGANINAVDKEGNTALLFASGLGHLAIVKYLVENTKADVTKQLENGEYPLTAASKNNHTEVVTYILSKGVDVNVMDFSKSSALLHAVKNNNLDLVNILLEHGADQNSKKLDILPIDEAIKQGYNDIAKTLIRSGGNINGNDESSSTLYVSCFYKNLELAKYLLSKNADIERINNWKKDTPLIISANYISFELVELLLKYNANINAQDENGNTALIDVCSVAKTIRNPRDLIKSTYYKRLKIVKLLLEHGANIEIADKNGINALMEASYSGHIDIVKLLVKYGSELNKKDKNGNTALTWAKKGINYEVVEYLESLGAK